MNKTLTPINSFKVTLVTSAIAFGALAFAYDPKITDYTPVETKSAPAYTAVAAMELDSKDSGTAVIRLNGFTLDVSFQFERIEDGYGVNGSEFMNADITNLAIDNVIDESGNTIRDFTTADDHRSINAMLVAHMLQNRILETV